MKKFLLGFALTLSMGAFAQNQEVPWMGKLINDFVPECYLIADSNDDYNHIILGGSMEYDFWVTDMFFFNKTNAEVEEWMQDYICTNHRFPNFAEVSKGRPIFKVYKPILNN
ncbi:hypothetical protein [Myroides odoratus]|uniref:Uncharacterized protein n=1 Tax=Myroides odoratus TaxID=256 RepID=A0A378RQX0_MYROD|nr:hypothetical protein [Myroides odoratus]QQU05578.1 hypothetical protein I6I89_01750 [Myroides odoratus]STZ28567.1 Uncharacterised protein [Myroides odoratus]